MIVLAVTPFLVLLTLFVVRRAAPKATVAISYRNDQYVSRVGCWMKAAGVPVFTIGLAVISDAPDIFGGILLAQGLAFALFFALLKRREATSGRVLLADPIWLFGARLKLFYVERVVVSS